jgi:hypothetical protein
METVYFSETSVSAYQSTQHHNPEEQYWRLHRREKLKSHYFNSFKHTGNYMYHLL